MGRTTGTGITSIIVVAIGYSSFIVGFCLMYWLDFRYRNRNVAYEEYYYYGLWRVCHIKQIPQRPFEKCASLVDISVPPDVSPLFTIVPEWYRATQAMEAIGLILGAVGLLLTVLFSCAQRMRRTKVLAATVSCCSAAAFCMISGVVVWATMINDRMNSPGITPASWWTFSWGFALSTGGAIAVVIGGLALLCDLRKL